jgi:hypothetical protein
MRPGHVKAVGGVRDAMAPARAAGGHSEWSRARALATEWLT